MTIRRGNELIHWNYFLALEEDLQRLARFVDLSGNDDTFSLEIARLLMAASAENDVVLKLLCKRVTPGTKVRTINAYFPVVTTALPGFLSFEVWLPRFDLRLKPWSAWRADHPPLWWTANNKVKHQRDTHFRDGSLKNCLNALGGLYVAVLHLYRNEAEGGELQQIPSLFNVSDTHFAGTAMTRLGHSFKYKFN